MAKRPQRKRRTSKKPRIGQTIMLRGAKYRIFKIHPFGTLDVVSLDGERAFRVSGLGF